MPLELCHLVHLQVLDLSSNDLSRKIPKCLNNITAMKQIEGQYVVITNTSYENQFNRQFRYDHVFSRLFPCGSYEDKLVLVWKGALYELKIQGLLKNNDLSSNKWVKFRGKSLNLLD